MTKEEKRKTKRFLELWELKKLREERIKEGLPASELESIQKNVKLHNFLHKVIGINNGLLEKMEKDYEEFPYHLLEKYKKRPIIFAPNHVRMQDIEVEMEATPIHHVLLSGDYENVHGSVAGILLEKNGILYFDMTDTVDRKNIQKVLYDVLSNGYNVLWYYEGTWNVSEKNPYNDGSYQIVQTAIDTNAIVIPISFDMIDHKKAVIRYGSPIDYREIYGQKKLSHEEKIEALDILKGEIGKGIIDIWEKYNFTYRDSLIKKYAPDLHSYPNKEEAFTFKKKEKYGTLHKCFEEYLDIVLKQWHFSLDDLESKRFVDKTKVEQEEVFDHLYNGLKPNMNNAFLFSKRNHH